MKDFNLEIVTEEDLLKYANIVLKLCKEHFILRKNIGYKDYEHESENFNVYNIVGDFKKIGVNYYFIKNNNIIVGTIASYEKQSEINGEPIIYVDSFYIFPEYRNMGFGKKSIDEIRRTNPRKKIELHCLYGNNAELFYDKIGGKKVKIVYTFE